MTTESTALTPVPTALTRPGITPETLYLMQMLAPTFHLCRWFGVGSPEQAIVLMAKAADLGLPITSAFEYFDVIEGKPALKPIGALALIHRSGRIDMQIDDTASDRCAVTMTRRDTGFSHTVIYTTDDAKAAGLIKQDKDGSAWRRFTKDMLRNRAIGRCARIVAPDILGGLYLTAELETPVEPIEEAANDRA